MDNIMIIKVLVALVAVLLGAMTQYEVDDDILLIEKRAALPVNRIKAFQLLSDMRNYKHWFPGIVDFEPIDDMNVALGKQYIEHQNWFLYGRIEFSYVITGYESPRYISFVSNSWWQPRIEIILERREGEDKSMYPTYLTYRMFTRRKSFLVNYLLVPMSQLSLGSKVRQALFNLKYILQK